MEVITDPAKLPADPSAIVDDTLISPAVWAALQHVELSTVYRNNTLARKRRAASILKPGDMPEPDETVGQTPMWLMSAYRAWDASRPGRGAGAGRPATRTGPRVRHRVELPISCPHCKHTITEADLAAAKKAADGKAG
jgi:hypothetical protein